MDETFHETFFHQDNYQNCFRRLKIFLRIQRRRCRRQCTKQFLLLLLRSSLKRIRWYIFVRHYVKSYRKYYFFSRSLLPLYFYGRIIKVSFLFLAEISRLAWSASRRTRWIVCRRNKGNTSTHCTRAPTRWSWSCVKMALIRTVSWITTLLPLPQCNYKVVLVWLVSKSELNLATWYLVQCTINTVHCYTLVIDVL